MDILSFYVPISIVLQAMSVSEFPSYYILCDKEKNNVKSFFLEYRICTLSIRYRTWHENDFIGSFFVCVF